MTSSQQTQRAARVRRPKSKTRYTPPEGAGLFFEIDAAQWLVVLPHTTPNFAKIGWAVDGIDDFGEPCWAVRVDSRGRRVSSLPLGVPRAFEHCARKVVSIEKAQRLLEFLQKFVAGVSP